MIDEFLADILVGAVAMSCLATTIWAAFGHFQRRELQPGAKVISGLTVGSAVVLIFLLISRQQPLFISLSGIVLMLGAEILFWLAIRETKDARLAQAFAIEAPRSIITTGPYRYIRHPFYSSYILYWTGFAIATWTVWSIPVLVGLYAIYWWVSIEEEEKFAETVNSESYRLYKQKAGRFLPKIRATM